MSDRGILYDCRRKIQYFVGRIVSDKLLSKLYFRIVLHEKLHLDNPRTFNEKIQWYKLYYCPVNEVVIKCADKAWLHLYLEEKGLGLYAVPILGTWEKSEDINFDKLPRQYVLKCNHGCGYNLIITDSKKADTIEIKKKLDLWLKEDFSNYNAEPHYGRIPKQIVCEQYLGDGKTKFLYDYKVHCFNGEPRFTLVCFDRDTDKTGANYVYYDVNWAHLNYSKTPNRDFIKPLCYDEMLTVSRKIACDFPFVRVDFYIVDNRLYIGELTFDPDGGLDNTIYKEADEAIGKMLDLSGVM